MPEEPINSVSKKQSKQMAFVGDKNESKRNFVSGRKEILCKKEKNEGHQHFCLFPYCFQKASFL